MEKAGPKTEGTNVKIIGGGSGGGVYGERATHTFD